MKIALKELFRKEEVIDLEKAIFSDSRDTKYKYVLFNEHHGQYYFGSTVAVQNNLVRLRRSVMKVEYPVMAHRLQQKAHVSQMSDWSMVVLHEGVSNERIRSVMSAYTEIKRCNPYEINSKENRKAYMVQDKQTNLVFVVTTSRELTPAVANARARHTATSLHKKLSAKMKACETMMSAREKRLCDELLEKLSRVARHAIAWDWVRINREIPLDKADILNDNMVRDYIQFSS